MGFKRYGFDDALHRLAKAMIDATSLFDFDRLPEVFGGHPRDPRHPHPGIYPDACSPQTWSASAVIQIFHMLTGVFAVAPLRTIVIDPALPEWMPQATIRHLRVGEECLSLRLRREADGRTGMKSSAGERVCGSSSSNPGTASIGSRWRSPRPSGVEALERRPLGPSFACHAAFA